MKTMKAAIFGVSLLIASPLLAHGSYDRWAGPLPSLVEQFLPADVPARDVLVHDGCFFYTYQGEVYEVVNANGRQICRG